MDGCALVQFPVLVFRINSVLHPRALLPHNFCLPLAVPGIYVDI